MWLALVGIVVSLILILSILNSKKYKNFPPGPSGWLSNFSQFGANPLKALTVWKAKYGAVVGCRIGEFRVVILNDPVDISKAFASKVLNSRPPFLPAMLYAGGHNHGTLTSADDVWKAVRECMVKNMKNLLTSATDVNNSLQLFQDMAPLFQKLQHCSSTNTDQLISIAEVRKLCYIPIANLVWHSLTGSELPQEAKIGLDDKLLSLQKVLWQPLRSPIWFLPTLAKWLPSSNKILKGIAEALSPLHQIVNKMVTDVEQDKDLEVSNSFVHTFLKGASSFQCLQGYEANHLKGTFFVLWHTACETVGNLLGWTLLWLSLYPEVQENLAKELGQADEKNLDLNQLPYTRALIQEVLRLSSTAPFANFHWSVQDYALPNGMLIPKETIVIGNLYGVHHDQDPTVWGDPEVFRPERFLSEGDNEPRDKPQKRFMLPFSAGLRSCPGQNFAKNFLLFALSKLLTEFRFDWNHPKLKPSSEEILEKSLVSIFRFVPDFELAVSKREIKE